MGIEAMSWIDQRKVKWWYKTTSYSRKTVLASADRFLKHLGRATGIIHLGKRSFISSVNDMGRLLLSHCCLDSGLFLLNGRTHGDRSGKCTHAQSVIDYGLVDAPTYSCVQSFKVLAKEDESDHMPIECVLKARGAQEGSRHDQGVVKSLCPGGTLQKGKSMYRNWNLLALFTNCVSLVRASGMGAWTWLLLLRGYTK